MYKRKSSEVEGSEDDDSYESEVRKWPKLEESPKYESDDDDDDDADDDADDDDDDDDDDVDASNDDKLEEEVGDNEDDLDDSDKSKERELSFNNFNGLGESEPEKPEVPLRKNTKTFAYKYMESYGYKEGKGLGRSEDGILEPVKASEQKGKRGFGFPRINLVESIKNYEADKEEEIFFDEEVIWLDNNHSDTVDASTLKTWVHYGPPKSGITSDSPFCDPNIIDGVLQSKNILDNLSENEKKSGRRRSNPFESICNAIFLNRAAMKMANMDFILDWMFTEPKRKNGENFVGPNELLYFADVCAGPGGFSEYVLYRKKWRAKGFGFTLKNENDFQLDKFIAGPSETFEPYYGANDDGDVYVPENIISFRDHVMKWTDGKGVHFMMADGGIHMGVNINDQEIICKKLYLCQCLVALFIVRPEGHFVVKLFDLYTEFSVGLIYLMYRCFDQILIVKPNTSRPANSERYLVCKWKRRDCNDIANHLFEINKKVPGHDKKWDKDVLELVPLKVLKDDTKFFDYIYNSNVSLGKRQIQNLIKMVKYAENSDLVDPRQQKLKINCLKKWEIPLEARAEPKKFDPRSKWLELVGKYDLELDYTGKEEGTKITSAEIFREKIITSKNSWNCVVMSEEESNSKVGFYLGLGKTNIQWHSKQERKWVKLNPELKFNLPQNTILYGEQIQEFTGHGLSQIKTSAFHIIDGLILGGEDIFNLSFIERTKRCKLFAKALFNKNFAIRVKERYYLGEIHKLWDKLDLRHLKSRKSSLFPAIPVDENSFFKAVGVMFIKDTKGVWDRYLSRNRGDYYLERNKPCVDNKKRGIFESDPKCATDYKEAYANFEECYKTRLLWWWDDGVVVHDEQRVKPDPKKLQKSAVMSILKTKIH